MSRRVAVTGVGLISPLGNDYLRIAEALREGRSGVRAMPAWTEYGLKSLVAGALEGIEAKREAAGLRHTA